MFPFALYMHAGYVRLQSGAMARFVKFPALDARTPWCRWVVVEETCELSFAGGVVEQVPGTASVANGWVSTVNDELYYNDIALFADAASARPAVTEHSLATGDYRKYVNRGVRGNVAYTQTRLFGSAWDRDQDLHLLAGSPRSGEEVLLVLSAPFEAAEPNVTLCLLCTVSRHQGSVRVGKPRVLQCMFMSAVATKSPFTAANVSGRVWTTSFYFDSKQVRYQAFDQAVARCAAVMRSRDLGATIKALPSAPSGLVQNAPRAKMFADQRTCLGVYEAPQNRMNLSDVFVE